MHETVINPRERKKKQTFDTAICEPQLATKKFPSPSIQIELSPPGQLVHVEISRDGDTTRRCTYTSQRRVANFPRRGFSIIPLAARFRQGLDRGCYWVKAATKVDETKLMVVVEMTGSSRVPPPRRSVVLRRALEAGSVWVHLVHSGRHGNFNHPLATAWFRATQSSKTLFSFRSFLLSVGFLLLSGFSRVSSYFASHPPSISLFASLLHRSIPLPFSLPTSSLLS